MAPGKRHWSPTPWFLAGTKASRRAKSSRTRYIPPGIASASAACAPGDLAVVPAIQPGVAKTLRLDPARIVLIGHSMGGFMAVESVAADQAIKAFVTISAADMAGRAQALVHEDGEAAGIEAMGTGLADEGMAPLSGCTPEGLARELVEHAPDWTFPSKVDALKDRTALVITSDDGLAQANLAFAAAPSPPPFARLATAGSPP